MIGGHLGFVSTVLSGFVSTAIPALSDSQLMCACAKFILDAYGNHSDTCSQHSGTTKNTYEHILSALDTMCRRSGYTTRRKNVTPSRGSKKGDLEIRDINLGGKRDLVIDVALVHDFSGNCSRDARCNGQLRYDDPDLLLNNAPSHLPCLVPTSFRPPKPARIPRGFRSQSTRHVVYLVLTLGSCPPATVPMKPKPFPTPSSLQLYSSSNILSS